MCEDEIDLSSPHSSYTLGKAWQTKQKWKEGADTHMFGYLAQRCPIGTSKSCIQSKHSQSMQHPFLVGGKKYTISVYGGSIYQTVLISTISPGSH